MSFNTTLAACSAGLAALFYAYMRVGKWDLGLTVNGFLAGLVAIYVPQLTGSGALTEFPLPVAGVLLLALLLINAAFWRPETDPYRVLRCPR